MTAKSRGYSVLGEARRWERIIHRNMLQLCTFMVRAPEAELVPTPTPEQVDTGEEWWVPPRPTQDPMERKERLAAPAAET